MYPSKRKKLDREVDKSEYRLESVRLQSFENWPCSWITGKSLAEAGLYYTGTEDTVKCFDCDIELMKWEKGDDPMFEHERSSARCRFTRNIPCGNVPIGTDPSKIPPAVRENDICGSYSSASRPKHFEYGKYDDRYATFATWPEALSQLKKPLADAGLFYTGNLDETICFQCGGELRDWELEDDPWEKHAKHHQNCSYVRRAKGNNWVNDIIRRMRNPKLETVESSTNDKLDEHFKEADNTNVAGGSSQNPTGSQNAVIESTGFGVASAEGSNKEQSIATTPNKKQVRVGVELCKLCGIRKLEIMFLPCGHMVACTECVRNMSIDDVQLMCNFCHKAVELSVSVCPSRGLSKIMMPKSLKWKRQF